MKAQAEKMLIGSLIPFWHGLRDDVYGGFYGRMDFDLTVDKKAEKGCILNSRILWFFANAYLTLKEDYLLDDAEHAYHFLKDHCIDKENGGVYWSLNYDGGASDSSKHTYNQAFAVYALAAYYEASQDAEALALAFELYRLIESKCSDQGGYGEAYDCVFKPVSNEKLSENGVMAARTMNTLLHIFEAYSGLYQANKNAEVAQNLRRILDVFVNKVYNPAKSRLEVFFDSDMNSIIDLHSYGHDIEASWLLDWGTSLLGDNELAGKVAALTSSLARTVFAAAYHDRSLWYEREKGINATYREWWVQAEALVGFLHEYHKNPEKAEYYNAARDIMAYIQEYMVDKRPGSEWYSRVDDKGRPDTGKAIVDLWKCPYHNGRMCFEITRRC